MEKISGIIKSSPRVSAVDFKDSGAVRPGAPAFGRPVGVSTLADNNVFNQTSVKATGVANEMAEWRHRDADKAAIAQRVSESFFGKNRRDAEPIVDNDEPSFDAIVNSPLTSGPRASNPAGFKTNEVGTLRAASSPNESPFLSQMDDDGDDVLQQPEGLFPKGSFLDRTA